METFTVKTDAKSAERAGLVQTVTKNLNEADAIALYLVLRRPSGLGRVSIVRESDKKTMVVDLVGATYSEGQFRGGHQVLVTEVQS